MKGGRRAEVALIRGRAHYVELVMGAMAKAKVSLWIATANVKGLRVEAPLGTRARARGAYISVLEMLGGLAARGVELRLLHGGLPRSPFARTSAPSPASPRARSPCAAAPASTSR